MIGSSEATNANKNYTHWYETRMPNIVKIKKIDKPDFNYVTPFGGLIAIDVGNDLQKTNNNVKIQTNNAVEALYYVHNKTTEEEWNRLKQEAKAPVFDIGCDTVEFLGQNHYLTNYKDDISTLPYPKEVMDVYQKLTSNSLITTNKFNLKQPTIRIHYSNYLHTAATASQAAAVIIIGSSYVTCSNTGCINLLDIKRVTGGDWGIIHEFNHQLQLDRYMTSLPGNPFNAPEWLYYSSPSYWGFGGQIEVSNNTLNIMSFISYLNLQNDRTDPEIIWKQGGHGWKFNGYTIAKKLNEQKNRSINASEQHYMAVMSLFGIEAYRQYSKNIFYPYIKDYKGDVITVPWYIRDYDLNTSFVYWISMVTSCDWSDFFNAFGLIDDKPLKPSEQKYSLKDNYNPPTKGKTGYEKLQGMEEIKKISKIAPAYSFYASEVSYENNDNFKEIARPFKVSETEPTTLKLEEYTNTYSNMFDLTNLQIVKKPKYGTLNEVRNSNGKKEFTYTPNQNHKNDLDEFVYKITSTQKDGVNGSLINKNTDFKKENDDIYFKVQLYQEDGNYKWVSPEVDNKYLESKETTISKNENVNIADIKVYNAANDNNDLLEQTATNNAYKLFDNNYYGKFWEPGNAFGKMKMVIPFNQAIDLTLSL